jgi:hypothetical protein
LRNCSAAAEASVSPLANCSVAAATRSNRTADVEAPTFAAGGDGLAGGFDFESVGIDDALSDGVASFELLTSAIWYPSLSRNETKNGD